LGGKCVSYETDPTSGAWIFDSQQPCPQTVEIDAPVDTTKLTDGQHDVQVIVESAAQAASTVLDETVTTDNLTAAASSGVENPGVSGGSAASAAYALRLDPGTAALARASFDRGYDNSAVTLSGTVLDSAGAPVPSATVSVQSATLSGTGFVRVAQALSNASGHFSIRVPRGDSRQSRIVVGSSAIVLQEAVRPSITLHAQALSGARVLFTGQVAINTADATAPLVLIEIYNQRDPAHPWWPIADVTPNRAGGSAPFTR
jgi:hypothetical protein